MPRSSLRCCLIRKISPARPDFFVSETCSGRPGGYGTSKGAYIHQNLLSPSAWMLARVQCASMLPYDERWYPPTLPPRMAHTIAEIRNQSSSTHLA